MSLQKYLTCTFFLLLFSCYSYSQSLTARPYTHSSDSLKLNSFFPDHVSLTDSIINYGKIFLHSPYRRGGKGLSNSFDCSGFTSFVYRNFGYKLGASSSDQAEQFDAVDRSNLKKGDLVFFSGRRAGKRVGHVGIVVSADQNGNFNFIHASTQHGVIISNSDEPYYLKRFIKAGRVVFNNQMMAVAPPSNKYKLLSKYNLNNDVSPVAGETTQTRKLIPAQYHKVMKGETLSFIAEKYGLTIDEVKSKNKIKGNKIKPGQRLKVKDAETVLLVQAVQPKDDAALSGNTLASDSSRLASNPVSSPEAASHTVKKGETLSTISRLYNTSVEQLKILNQVMAGGVLYIGQKLRVRSNDKEKKAPAAEPVRQEVIPLVQSEPKTDAETKVETPVVVRPARHRVVGGETLYGIAKQYDISVEELQKINKLKTNNLRAGQIIRLSSAAPAEPETTVKPSKTATKKEQPTPKITHKVKPGETYYSIAREYGCKVDELKKWNKKSGNKIKVGEKIIIHTAPN